MKENAGKAHTRKVLRVDTARQDSQLTEVDNTAESLSDTLVSAIQWVVCAIQNWKHHLDRAVFPRQSKTVCGDGQVIETIKANFFNYLRGHVVEPDVMINRKPAVTIQLNKRENDIAVFIFQKIIRNEDIDIDYFDTATG